MSDHAEHQITGAVRSILVAAAVLPASQIDVERSHSYTSGDAYPRINVELGGDEPLSDRNVNVQDTLLTLITSTVMRGDNQADDGGQLQSDLRRDIHLAMMADRHLSLPDLVINTEPGPADEPEVDTEAEFPVRTRRIAWLIHYRTLTTDPTRSS